MADIHFRPRLNKRRILSHYEYTVHSVNAYAVRNVAQPDEEFGNFASKSDFKDLVPEGAVWISEKSVGKEAVFFIANALTYMQQTARGVAEDDAYQAGLDVEQTLREQVTGLEYRDGKPHKQVPDDIYLEHYLTLPDEEFPVDVWIVDGNLVRCYYKTDYTEGGHGIVYPWVPKREIWIEDGVDRREIPFILAHEYLEHRLMRDEGIEYDPAHEICAKMEFKLRKRVGVHQLLVPGRRKMEKADCRKLVKPEVFDYVVNHYVKTNPKLKAG